MASHISFVARKEILRGKDDVNFIIGANAESVTQDFSSGESPATTTMLLISDGMNAVGPLLRGAEVVRDISSHTFVVHYS